MVKAGCELETGNVAGLEMVPVITDHYNYNFGDNVNGSMGILDNYLN